MDIEFIFNYIFFSYLEIFDLLLHLSLTLILKLVNFFSYY